jgi:sugar/nucleoside kinase (ribokinase family)
MASARPQKKILVIGELNVDLILSGLDAFPTLGQEILADELSVVLGSASAIYAAGLARLGAHVDFVGKLGADHYGDFIRQQLRQRGVGIQHLIRDESVRTGMTISLTSPHDRALITYLGSIPQLRLADVNIAILQHYRHLHVSSYFLQKGLQVGLPTLFRQAHEAGLTVSLDTGWDPKGRWGGDALLALLEQVDLFMPNEDEARAIARVDDVGQALCELVKRARWVVVKRGAAGATSLRDGQIVHSPAFPVNVVDTTGAGDSFNAGLTFAHVVLGLPLREALRFANACGAHSTTGLGGTAAQPTLEQVQTLLKEQMSPRLPLRNRNAVT